VISLPSSAPAQAFGRLRRFIDGPRAVERCELCARALARAHEHLVEPGERRLLCACVFCAVLFGNQLGSKFKRLPRRVRSLETFAMSEAQWDALRLPIDLAFFYHNSPRNRVVACYPGPAGATESLLSLSAWDEVVTANPVLAPMESDVEALLVNRVVSPRRRESADYFLVPIDECYRLVGLIRAHWRGLSGGADVWHHIGSYFDELRARAQTEPASGA
jgi:hypothetical protein